MKQGTDFPAENAAQLVTILPSSRATEPEEKLGVIPKGTLAAKDGRIIWVGPVVEASKQVSLLPGGKVMDASGKVVLPGFIDSHPHLVFAGTREKEFELRPQGIS